MRNLTEDQKVFLFIAGIGTLCASLAILLL